MLLGVMQVLNTRMLLSSGGRIRRLLTRAKGLPTSWCPAAGCSGTSLLPGPSSLLMKLAEHCTACACPEGAQGAPGSKPQGTECTPPAQTTSPGASGNAAAGHLHGTHHLKILQHFTEEASYFLCTMLPLRWAHLYAVLGFFCSPTGPMRYQSTRKNGSTFRNRLFHIPSKTYQKM